MELCDGTPIMNATDKFVEECTAPIIVASPKYENEIIRDELSDNINQQRIIRVTWLLECVLKEYIKSLAW